MYIPWHFEGYVFGCSEMLSPIAIGTIMIGKGETLRIVRRRYGALREPIDAYK